MRCFILYSNEGRTAPDFRDLMSAGRLDIVAHAIIHAYFVSNKIRRDVEFHLVLNGPPDPPKHIEILPDNSVPFSKKDIGTLIKIALRRYREGLKRKVFDGMFVEKNDILSVIEEVREKGYSLVLLDKYGVDIMECDIPNNPAFILGDHLGIPYKIKKKIKKIADLIVSLGDVEYFTSQCIAIVNFVLDRKYGAALEDFKQ